MGTRYKGKSGQVKIGSTVLAVTSWDFKHHNDLQDVTDTGNAGKRDFEDGLEHCEGKFEACWKATAAPYGAKFGGKLKAGQEPTLELKAHSADATYVFSGTVIIEDVETSAPVDGTIKYTVSWKSKPDFTIDDGSTT